MDRCMGHPAMNGEYPDRDQRVAVCSSLWRRRAEKAAGDDEPLLTRLAGRMEPAMRDAFLAAVRGAAGVVDLEALAGAVASGRMSSVEAQAQLGRLPADLRAALQPVLGRTFALGVAAGAEAAGTAAGLTYGFDLVNPESILWVRTHAAKLVTEVGDSTRQAVRDLVEVGVAEGRAPDVLARQIREVLGLRSDQVAAVERFRARLLGQGVDADRIAARTAKYADAQLHARALMVARTETIAASNEGQQALWRAAAAAGDLAPSETRRVWVVTRDDRLDEEICEPLDGAEAELGGVFPGGYMNPPAHPNCLPAGALISPGPKVTGQTERMYEGDLCILRTAGGHRLAVTPNHPVLTPRGWVPARLAHEVGYVVRSLLRQRVPAPFDLDQQDAPALIEEIAEAFRRSHRVAAATVPTSPEDFHGDAVDGQVAVVRADRLLLGDVVPAGSEHGREPVLVGAGVEGEALDCRGVQGFLGRRLLAAQNSRVRGGGLCGALGGGHPRPLQGLGRRLPAGMDAAFAEAEVDDPAADAKLARQLIDGFAGPVAFDQVLDVEIIPFHGIVYNLQTTEGWYIADGIITHNCRCATVLRFKDDAAEPEEGPGSVSNPIQAPRRPTPLTPSVPAPQAPAPARPQGPAREPLLPDLPAEAPRFDSADVAHLWFKDTLRVDAKFSGAEVDVSIAQHVADVFLQQARAGRNLPDSLSVRPMRDTATIASFTHVTVRPRAPRSFITVNSDSTFWKDPARAADQLHRQRWFSDGDASHPVRHELGHLNHWKRSPGWYEKLQTSADDAAALRERQGVVNREVSRYASTNPAEFVAEVFTGRASGRTYSTDVMSLYEKFRGPAL